MVGVYVSSSPQKRFAVLRSYVRGIQIQDEGTTITDVGSETWSNIPGIPGYRIVYEVRPVVKGWSSNRYTLDWFVLGCWWRTDASPSQHPQAYSVDYVTDAVDSMPYVRIRNPLTIGIKKLYVNPPAPPGYWLPPFPS